MIGSAFWIAAARARESLRPDRLFDDPWAARLAGERGVSAMAASERASGGENAYLPVRTRYFDDAILAAVADGVRQIVLLGAGLDTRAYRLALPADLTWFELDHAELFATKEPVLADATTVCRRLTVPADLALDWSVALRAAGFDAGARTAWVAEGLFFYLGPAAVGALLRDTAAMSAPDSVFLADVMGAAGLAQPSMDAYRRYREASALPPPFGHDHPEVLLAENGWNVGIHTWAGAPDAHFGRFPAAARPPADGTARSGGRAHLVTGRRPARGPG